MRLTRTAKPTEPALDPPALPAGHALVVDALSKSYRSGKHPVPALREVSVAVDQASFTAVMGPSGSGKSTFLQCAAGLDRPSSGRVLLGGADLGALNETELTELRRRRVGFVFQAYNLIASLQVSDNITLPLRLAERTVDRAFLDEVVRAVGLEDRLRHYPHQLSGGQQQRVAIARALCTRPEVIFADEPTGALDTRTGRTILALLRSTVDQLAQTVVMVTHDPVAASFADRVLFLADGRLTDELIRPTAEQVAERLTHLGEW